MTGNESCEIHAETGPMGNSVGMFGHFVSMVGIVVPACMLPDAALVGSLIYVASS